MVSTQIHAGAAFGKPKGASSAEGDQYRLLFRSDDFPEAAADALSRLAASVQWKGGPNDAPFPPFYALWPVGNDNRGVLAARVLDSGRDALGRAHTIRVEAVFFAVAEAGASASIAAKYMAGDGWPKGPWGDKEKIALAAGAVVSDALLHAVADLVEKLGRVPRYLTSSHSCFFAQGFDFIDAPGTAPNNPARDASGESNASLPNKIPNVQNAAPSRGTWRIRLLGIAFLLAVSLIIGFLGGRQVEGKQLQQSLQSADDKAQALSQKVQRLKSELEAAKRQNRDSDKLRSENHELRAEKNAFDGYWKVIKEHDIKSPDHLRSRLIRRSDEERDPATEGQTGRLRWPWP